MRSDTPQSLFQPPTMTEAQSESDADVAALKGDQENGREEGWEVVSTAVEEAGEEEEDDGDDDEDKDRLAATLANLSLAPDTGKILESFDIAGIARAIRDKKISNVVLAVGAGIRYEMTAILTLARRRCCSSSDDDSVLEIGSLDRRARGMVGGSSETPNRCCCFSCWFFF